jgi:hypothetical protein
MKKFIHLGIALILLITSIIGIPITYAKASSNEVYARIITHDTPFYKSPFDENPTFYLPYTYYVKVLNYQQDLAHIECYGDGNITAIDGFVPTEYLYIDNLEVTSPFVVLELTTVETAILYEDSSLLVQSQYIFKDRKLNYYGQLTSNGITLYYVGYNSKLGYVKESDVYPFSIPPHPNELTFLTPEVEETPHQENTSKTQDFFGIKIAIIICLLFAGFIGLFVALSNKREKTVATTFYDENDYE